MKTTFKDVLKHAQAIFEIDLSLFDEKFQPDYLAATYLLSLLSKVSGYNINHISPLNLMQNDPQSLGQVEELLFKLSERDSTIQSYSSFESLEQMRGTHLNSFCSIPTPTVTINQNKMTSDISESGFSSTNILTSKTSCPGFQSVSCGLGTLTEDDLNSFSSLSVNFADDERSIPSSYHSDSVSVSKFDNDNDQPLSYYVQLLEYRMRHLQFSIKSYGESKITNDGVIRCISNLRKDLIPLLTGLADNIATIDQQLHNKRTSNCKICKCCLK